MDARFYNSEEINIEQLANDLENIYRAQGYQVQQITTKDQVMVQLKKGGDFETLIGMGVALSVIIQRTAGGVLGMIGQQKWMDKAAAGAVGAVGLVIPVLLPLAVTAGVGALRQMSLANQVLNVVDGLVRQQRPGIQGGPIPVQLMPQLQQQWAPPRYSPPPPVYTPPVQYIPPPQPQPQPQMVISQPAVAPAPAPATNKSGRKVMCAKFQKELPGLDSPPWPGELGQRIFENVSKDAWKLWEERMKMILNEYRLMPWQKEAQDLVAKHMEDFFFGDGAALPPGYVPQQSK